MFHLRPRSTIAISSLLLAVLVLGCSSGTGGSVETVAPTGSTAASAAASGATAGTRPSSPAIVKIVSPVSGSTITGSSVHLVLTLTGATIVQATTTDIRPDQGHVHLYVDGVLFSMNYGLEQDLPVKPGTYVLKAEFVASDHAPFNPRVWSPEVFFTVK
jgi:hypothetical protein